MEVRMEIESTRSIKRIILRIQDLLPCVQIRSILDSIRLLRGMQIAVHVSQLMNDAANEIVAQRCVVRRHLIRFKDWTASRDGPGRLVP